MGFLRKRGTTEHGYVEERLSAYLDGALSPSERTSVERHLASCPKCRWSFDTLRQTVQWTRELPFVPVPRVFTIPVAAQPARTLRPSSAPRARRSWGLPVLQAATAALALLFFFAVAGDVWLTGFLPAPGPESEVALQEAPYAAPVAEPALEVPVADGVQGTIVVEAEKAVVVEATAAGAQALPSPTQVAESAESAAVLEAEAPQAGAEESPSSAMGTTAFAPKDEPAPSVESSVDDGERRAAAPEAESLMVSEATASPEAAVGSGAGAVATEEAQASSLPAPAVAATVEPTLVSKAQEQEPPVPDRQEESWPRALRESVAPWLGTAQVLLGAAFLLLGLVTAIATLRRLRAR